MAEFPSMPLWTDAYLSDTRKLTTIMHGAYLLLLMTAWRAKSHDLPDDDKILAQEAGLSAAQWLRIKPAIKEFYRVENGRWYNDRLLDEIEAVRRITKQRSDAGKASALKRKHRDSTGVQRGTTPQTYRGVGQLRKMLGNKEESDHVSTSYRRAKTCANRARQKSMR